MKSFRSLVGRDTVGFQSTGMVNGGASNSPVLPLEQVAYVRENKLNRVQSFNVSAPILASRKAMKMGGERMRLGLVVLLTVAYVAFVLFMLYISTGRPTVGLTAQRDEGGLWRVQSLSPAGLSYDQGIRPGDVIKTALDNSGHTIDLENLGVTTSDFSSAVTLTVSSAQAGSPDMVLVNTANQRPDNPLQRWGYTLLSLIFFAVGAPVFIKARQRSGASAFYFFCVTTAVGLAAAPAMYMRSTWILALVFVIAAAWAGSFALFFLEFPVRVGKTRLWHSLILATLAVCQLTIMLGYIWVLMGHIDTYQTLRALLGAYMSGCIVSGLAILLRSLVTEKSREIRQQLFLLLGGTAVAVGPFILLVALPTTFIKRSLVSMEVSSLALAIMPLAFAYAITQHQLLGVHNFVRRSVVYVLMGFSVLVVFSLAASTVSTLVPDGWWKNEVGSLGFGFFVFLIALSFGYVQRRVERLVDRYIYHDAYDYKDALLQFSAQLASEQNLHVLADELVGRTCRLMNLTCGVLLLASQPGSEDAARSAPALQDLSGTDQELGEAETEYNNSMLRNFSLTGPLSGSGGGAHNLYTDTDQGHIYLEPYAMYGRLAGSLLSGLHAELFNLGIVLRDTSTAAQLIQLEDNPSDNPERQARLSNSTSGFIMAQPNQSAATEITAGGGQGFDGVRSYLGVPLWTRSYFVGVLCLGGKKSGERFTKDDISLLSTLGSQSALAIYNAQLYEAREQALLDTIKALAHAIEAKDTYTINHCEKITGRAVALAQAMALPRQDVENIRLGSILHDVGKIGIPDAVLNKPSKLNDEEYEIIKQHAQIGARIVQSVGALQGVVPIVRHHQERFDGRGYPAGLAGADIPVGARIIAAVDAYGAMTEDRVYRKALGHEKAIAELKRYAGTQFDPHVVNTFIHILKEQPELAERDTSEECLITQLQG